MEKAGKTIIENLEFFGSGGEGRKSFVVYTGIVKSVDTEAYTCEVELNVNAEGNVTKGVTINVAMEVTEGLILVPAADSVVWVADLDGGGNMGLIKCGVLQSMFVKIADCSCQFVNGDVKFHVGGSEVNIGSEIVQINASDYISLHGEAFGGLTKTLELKTQIEKLNTLVSHLVNVIMTAAILEPGGGSPSALQSALKAAIISDSVGDFSNIENTKVRHG